MTQLCTLSPVELALNRPSDAYSFKVASGFSENLCTSVIECSVTKYCVQWQLNRRRAKQVLCEQEPDRRVTSHVKTEAFIFSRGMFCSQRVQ